MKKRTVQGVGINDADYPVVNCPYYKRWANMLARGYSEKLKAYSPTYRDVTVCEEWLIFSNFRSWMIEQDWEGKELDKDILVPGNKIYSPETCRFIDQALNVLINTSTRKSDFGTGVAWDSEVDLYVAKIHIKNKLQIINHFDTPKEAHAAYIDAKVQEIQRQQALQTDPAIVQGLELHIVAVREEECPWLTPAYL